MDTQYRYERSDRVAEVLTGQRFLERVPPSQGLGAIDPTPDQGPLPPVAGLIDGNTVTPVVPPLSIGAGDTDRNIGVDLGVRRDALAAIYIYTDRISSATVQWTVWLSDDNLTWSDAETQGARSTFDPSLLRYEIEFTEVAARFIKVVNSGTNAIPGVMVTEMVVFESVPVKNGEEIDSSSHIADLRLGWDINPQWNTALELSGRIEPSSGSVSQRKSYDYNLRTQYHRGFRSSHTLVFGQSWQEQQDESRDLREDSAAYTFAYDPLAALGTSTSMSFRNSAEGGLTSLRSLSARTGATASPWRSVRTSAEVGVSAVDQPIVAYETESWNTRVTLDAEITRWARSWISWLHQESRGGPEETLRVLRRLSFSLDLRLSRAITGRAEIDLTDDRQFQSSQIYVLSWRSADRLVLSVQYRGDQRQGGAKSRQVYFDAHLVAFKRLIGLRNVTAYVQFSDLEQESSGVSSIISWQQGLRASF